MGKTISLQSSKTPFLFKKAAANLFENHSLHYLRYLQNSLRLQIHHLLGYNPSDIYNKTKLNKKRSIEIFSTNQDISLVGNNNKLYRGRIDSCQIIPLKTSKDKKMKIKSKNIDENNEKIQIQFDQTINNEHLYEYFDWQTHINEQVITGNCLILFNIINFLRIYLMNFMKNYFNIGNQFYVKIKYVSVIQN